MNKILWDLLDAIPAYDSFLTLEELDASSRQLAADYPECVDLFEIGKTGEGRPLLCLKIGEGSKNALFFGCPHPNEPIGTMLLEHFTQQLAARPELRDELDYTFYVVKAWDADGLVKNEGWLKGPYTLHQYSRYFFRPASRVQVDWTFPIDYKDMHFHDTMPETQAMMNLIDEIKPVFNYALHNAGFGGVYWYVSEDMPEVYESLREAAERQNIPLHLGEPESASLKILGPAVLLAEGIEVEYDFLEKYGAKDIPSILTSGTSSDSYARGKYGTFTFLTELPYFYDPRISDPTLTSTTRSESVLMKLDWTEKSNQQVAAILNCSGKWMSANNPYLMTVEDYTKGLEIESMRKMALEDPAYERMATMAEFFDNVWINRFYRLLAYGMLIRAHEHELEKRPNSEAQAKLFEGKQKAEILHMELAEELEKELNYEVIPIKKLVNIQLECGLKMAQHIHKIK
ncbi:MAG TPA: M14 family zinc carboxypeptidase [Clostridia bacterium]|nr:M14 family zinc carboxypeptidase [Clostridia bacterium]